VPTIASTTGTFKAYPQNAYLFGIVREWFSTINPRFSPAKKLAATRKTHLAGELNAFGPPATAIFAQILHNSSNQKKAWPKNRGHLVVDIATVAAHWFARDRPPLSIFHPHRQLSQTFLSLWIHPESGLIIFAFLWRENQVESAASVVSKNVFIVIICEHKWLARFDIQFSRIIISRPPAHICRKTESFRIRHAQAPSVECIFPPLVLQEAYDSSSALNVGIRATSPRGSVHHGKFWFGNHSQPGTRDVFRYFGHLWGGRKKPATRQNSASKQ
jgi:hypothetical protein